MNNKVTEMLTIQRILTDRESNRRTLRWRRCGVENLKAASATQLGSLAHLTRFTCCSANGQTMKSMYSATSLSHGLFKSIQS